MVSGEKIPIDKKLIMIFTKLKKILKSDQYKIKVFLFKPKCNGILEVSRFKSAGY